MSDSDLTVSDVARLLRIRRDAVVAHLRAGTLVGCDVSPPGARHKAYRVTRQALDDFRAGRSAAVTPTRRVRTPKRQEVTQYY